MRSRYLRFKPHENIRAALSSLQKRECDAVVYDAPILRYMIFHDPSGDLFVLPGTFQQQDYAFALRSNSPLRESVNRSLLRQISSPQWDDVLATYLGGDLQ